MAAPDQKFDLPILKDSTAARSSPPYMFFSITLTDSDNEFLPHCLFHELSVPDIIARLQNYKCNVRKDAGRHIICPGRTRISGDFGALTTCDYLLACPLCLGLDFMKEDEALMNGDKVSVNAATHKLSERLKELEYCMYALNFVAQLPSRLKFHR